MRQRTASKINDLLNRNHGCLPVTANYAFCSSLLSRTAYATSAVHLPPALIQGWVLFPVAS